MFKGVINLFLIFIICITAAGIPVDGNTLDFSKYASVYSENTKVSYTTDSKNSNITNPTTINLTIKSDTPLGELTHELKDSFLLNVFDENQQLSTYSPSDFIISQETNNDNETVLTLDLSQDSLQLQNGTYMFKFHSEHESLSNANPLEIEVLYKPIAPYIAARNTISSGLMDLTLYFPDINSRKYLIPITRFVDHTTAIVRTTVDNLQVGSDILGFENPIPSIPRLQVSNGILTVYLPANLDQYNESAEYGDFALNSIVNSLTATPGVDSIKFLVNGRESDDFFYGHSTTPLYEPDLKTPKAYLYMDINKSRTVLVPIDTSIPEESNTLTELFNILQSATYNGKNLENLFPTVPKSIQLINATREGNIININLSKDLLYIYPEREDLQKLIIDSILFTYCSIPEVEKVHFFIEGQSIESFAGFNLSQPLSKPKYINPEKE